MPRDRSHQVAILSSFGIDIDRDDSFDVNTHYDCKTDLHVAQGLL